MTCLDKEHIYYIFSFIIPALIFYGLLLPLSIIIYLVKNKNNFSKINFQYKFGFLYRDYKLGLFYWELL